MEPSAAQLVARFLRANGYHETLTTFIKEAGLPPDAGASSSKALTIEQILQEKKTFDLSANFERLGVEDDEKRWHAPAPSVPSVLKTLPSNSNILSTRVNRLILSDAASADHVLISSTADRRLNLIRTDDSTFTLAHSYDNLQDSPILDSCILRLRYLIVSSMSGCVRLYELASGVLLEERRDHAKYVVRIVVWDSETVTYLATAGWDGKVLLYVVQLAGGSGPKIQEPIASLKLATNPEAICFINHPESPLPILLATRRDSTFLYYYEIPTSTAGPTQELRLLGRQNLAPHSNAWVAFTPSAVEVCPTDSTVVAVATSAVPHMKLIIVQLLLPPMTQPPSAPRSVPNLERPSALFSSSDLEHEGRYATQDSQARAELAVQDREEAAIFIQCSTLAPQTQYSTPTLTWRPDGSGVWVNSDDGIVRGIEASTGKVVASLEEHEPGSKIRCLWAGYVQAQNGEGLHKEEWLVSGGFDQRLIVWKVA